MITQNVRLLAYLDDIGSITQMEASARLGIARLSARIDELRERHIIYTRLIKVRNRWGKQVRVAQYTLKEADYEVELDR